MPFFKFDSLSGRLSAASSSKAYNPAGLNAAANVPSDSSTFKFESSKVKVASMNGAGLGNVFQRQVHHESSKAIGIIPASPGYARLVALQRRFAINDGLLIWQKLGARDFGLYYATWAGIAVGTAYSLYILYKMSYPQKQE